MNARVHEYEHVLMYNLWVQPPVTTVVLKLSGRGLHCEQCIRRIRKIITQTQGVLNVAINRNWDTATVKGVMDAKALAENLRDKMKREVKIVPPKKEEEGGEAKDKEGSGCRKAAEIIGGWGKVEGQRMEFQGACGYGQCVNGERTQLYEPVLHAPYPPYYAPPSASYTDFRYAGYPLFSDAYMHSPQIFSDENPNACSVM